MSRDKRQRDEMAAALLALDALLESTLISTTTREQVIVLQEQLERDLREREQEQRKTVAA